MRRGPSPLASHRQAGQPVSVPTFVVSCAVLLLLGSQVGWLLCAKWGGVPGQWVSATHSGQGDHVSATLSQGNAEDAWGQALQHRAPDPANGTSASRGAGGSGVGGGGSGADSDSDASSMISSRYAFNASARYMEWAPYRCAKTPTPRTHAHMHTHRATPFWERDGCT